MAPILGTGLSLSLQCKTVQPGNLTTLNFAAAKLETRSRVMPNPITFPFFVKMFVLCYRAKICHFFQQLQLNAGKKRLLRVQTN